MSDDVTIAQMRLLTAFETHDSMSGVARHLGLSQPTVSANLSKLERRLGVRLMERTSSGSRLTEEGRMISTWARGLIREADDLEALLADRVGRARPPLRVAASMTIAEYLMPHWLLRASSEAGSTRGDVDLVVANSERVMELVERRTVSLGFTEGLTLREGLRSATVGQDRLTVIVRPGHDWATRLLPLSVKELLSGELIVREPGSGTREVFEQALERVGRSIPAHTVTMGSTSTIKTAVRAADAAGVVSRLAVRDELESGSLLEVTVNSISLTRRLNAVWIGQLGRDPRMSSLIDAARSESRSEAPSDGRLRR